MTALTLFQNQGMVLCPTLGLDTLAVSSRLGIDLLANAGGADKGYGLDPGVGEKNIRFVVAACDQIHNALGKSCFSVE